MFPDKDDPAVSDLHLEQLFEHSKRAITTTYEVHSIRSLVDDCFKLTDDWSMKSRIETWDINKSLVQADAHAIDMDIPEVAESILLMYGRPAAARIQTGCKIAELMVMFARTMYTESTASFLVVGILSIDAVCSQNNSRHRAALVTLRDALSPIHWPLAVTITSAICAIFSSDLSQKVNTFLRSVTNQENPS
jgi:hypothetical protein